MNIQTSFMQAITTKYHGPTNTKGSRVSATTTAGRKKFFSWDYELDVDQNHIKACREMVDYMGWNFGQKLVGGPTETGFVFVGVEGGNNE